MLNLADFTSLSLVLIMPVIAAAYAHSEKATTVTTVLLATGSLALGFAFAAAVRRFAYWLLKKNSGVCFILYLVLPALAIPVAIGSVAGISYLILK